VIYSEHMQMEGMVLGTGNEAWGVGQKESGPLVPAEAPLPTPQDLSSSVSQTERDIILAALRSDNGNRQLVAKRLGISPRTLRYKLARLRDAGVEV
jgi:two-component system response regulator FlrC